MPFMIAHSQNFGSLSTTKELARDPTGFERDLEIYWHNSVGWHESQGFDVFGSPESVSLACRR